MTLVTAEHVVTDIGEDAQPPVILRDQLEGSVLSRVSSRWCAVARLDDVVAQQGTVRDVNLPLEVQETIIFFPLEDAIPQLARALGPESLQSVCNFLLFLRAIADALPEGGGLGEGCGGSNLKQLGFQHNLRAVVFFVRNMERRGTRERVREEVCLAGAMDDAEVVLSEIGSPAGLSSREVLCSLPVL